MAELIHKRFEVVECPDGYAKPSIESNIESVNVGSNLNGLGRL